MAKPKHSDIGASGAERWWNCPGSRALARLAGPQFTSVYAAEGTAAHKLREVCLADGTDAEDHIDRVIVVPPAWKGDHRYEFVVDEGMAEAVQVHLDRIRAIIEKYPDAEVSHEVGLDLSHLHPDAYGTGDTTIYIPSEQWLIVDDYKHGAGVVKKAKGNPQLLYYAVGATRRYHNRGIKKITLCIVQPRGKNTSNPIDEHTFPAVDLLEWRADLKDAMFRTEDPKAPRKVDLDGGAGYCRFCPGAAICPDYRDEVHRQAQVDFADGEPTTAPLEDMTLDNLGTLLDRADFILGWGGAIKEFAHNEAMRGRVATGHKLVAKRSNRRWRDEAEAAATILKKYKVKRADIYKETFKSPAQIEKLLGIKKPDVLADLTMKPDNGYSLVPEKDERPEKSSSAQTDFTPVPERN